MGGQHGQRVHNAGPEFTMVTRFDSSAQMLPLVYRLFYGFLRRHVMAAAPANQLFDMQMIGAPVIITNCRTVNLYLPLCLAYNFLFATNLVQRRRLDI